MDCMIAFVMGLAVFICRLTMYSSANGASIVNF